MFAYAETIEVDAQEGHAGAAQGGLMSPDSTIAVLSYVTFFILLAILYKFAWKPILAVLEARENTIRQSLDDAKKAKEELQKVQEASRQMIKEADEQAKIIVERSRKAAVEAAKVIEHQAKEEAQIMLTNANQEIKKIIEKAQITLRQESVHWAVGLAQKILKENLDESKQQKLIDQFIKDWKPESIQ